MEKSDHGFLLKVYFCRSKSSVASIVRYLWKKSIFWFKKEEKRKEKIEKKGGASPKLRCTSKSTIVFLNASYVPVDRGIRSIDQIHIYFVGEKIAGGSGS